MDTGEAFRVILRRWRLAVPVLVLTVVAVVVVYVTWPTKYQSTAQLGLMGEPPWPLRRATATTLMSLIAASRHWRASGRRFVIR